MIFLGIEILSVALYVLWRLSSGASGRSSSGLST